VAISTINTYHPGHSTADRIAHIASMRHILHLLNTPHMIQRVETRRQSNVETAGLVIDERVERKAVE